MGILSTVTSGKKIGAQIHCIAGINGVGKTSWAAASPSPIILDFEDGSAHLDVKRIESKKIATFESVKAVLKELIETDHGYKNVVIDSVESLEFIINKHLCLDEKVGSIEQWGGGYGKGYNRARELMKEIFDDLKILKEKGISSILIAHTQVKTVADPVLNESYDRVIMRCNDKMAAVVRDLSDNVFYATYKTFATTEKNKAKAKAFGDGQRVMYTQWRPGFDAKNRLELPLEIPLSYDTFLENCNQDATTETLVADINSMSENLDDTLRASVKQQVEKFKTNSVKLKEIKNRLMKYVA